MRLSGVRVAFLAFAASASLSVALAGDLWIQPEPAAPSPGQQITLRLFEGEPFAGQERPSDPDRTERFLRLWKKGRANLAGREERAPAARFIAAEPGAQLIVYDSPSAGSYCKAVIVVGEPAAGDPLRWSELGQRLELVPQSDPVELLAGANTLDIQVLFEREPLAGARVVAFPAAAPREGLRAAITDEIGLVRLRLDHPGWWLVRVRHRPRGADGHSASGSELTATLTIAAGER
jgi:hypothetical protein